MCTATTFPKDQSLGVSLLMPYTWVSLILDFSQMFLAIQKHPEIPNVIILDNPYYCNLSKKSNPGDISLLMLLGVPSL